MVPSLDYEAIFKSLKDASIAFLKANIIRTAVIGAVAIFILVLIGVTRATKAAALAKLTSLDPSVAQAEVLQLCSTHDLFDTLTSTEDPNTPSTSEANLQSASIREQAAVNLDALVSQKKIPLDIAMDNLFELDKDSDTTVQTSAVTGLATLAEQSDANLQIVVHKLGDGDPDVRTAAATALGDVKGARAASLVAPLLTDPDASSAAQTALQDIGPDSIPFLIPMLPAADNDLRAQIVTTLGNIGDESAVPTIVQQCDLTPVVPDVHRLAILALANAILKSYPPNPSLTFGASGANPVAPRVISAQDNSSAQIAEPVFIKALADPTQDNFARARAALALGRIGGDAAAQTLVAALADFDSRVVTAATSALQEAGPTAVPFLAGRLGSPNIQVRVAAANALGGISNPAALAAIKIALRDPSPDVRQAAASALGLGANPASIALLVPALNDPDGLVASAASESLHMIGKPAIPALISLLGSGNPVLALQASDALRAIGAPAQPYVLAALGTGPDAQRAWAAVTIAQLQDYSAEPKLEALASGAMPQARYAAKQALEQLGRV